MIKIMKVVSVYLCCLMLLLPTASAISVMQEENTALSITESIGGMTQVPTKEEYVEELKKTEQELELELEGPVGMLVGVIYGTIWLGKMILEKSGLFKLKEAPIEKEDL